MKKIGSHGHHSFFTFEHEGEEHRIDVKQMTQEDLEAEGITTDMLKDMVETLTKPSPGPGPSAFWMDGVWYEKGPDGKWREQEWIEQEEDDGAD